MTAHRVPAIQKQGLFTPYDPPTATEAALYLDERSLAQVESVEDIQGDLERSGFSQNAAQYIPGFPKPDKADSNFIADFKKAARHDIQQDLMKLSKSSAQIISLREDTLGERMSLREQRNSLLELAKCVSDQRAQFVSVLRDCFETTRNFNFNELSAQYHAILAAQDSYGEVEANYFEAQCKYHTAEDVYNYKEWELTKAERDGRSDYIESSSSNQTRPQSTVCSNPPGKSSFLSSEEDEDDRRTGEFPPKLEVVNMLRERLVELFGELRQIEEQIENRKSLSIPWKPDYEHMDHLRRFIAGTQEELRQAELDLDPSLVHDEISMTSWNRPNLNDRDLSTAVAEDITPTRPGSEVSEYSEDFTETAGRISEWILGMLKNSKHEQNRLKAMLTDLLPDDNNWWRIVLENWKCGDGPWADAAQRVGESQADSTVKSIQYSQPARSKWPVLLGLPLGKDYDLREHRHSWPGRDKEPFEMPIACSAPATTRLRIHDIHMSDRPRLEAADDAACMCV